MVTGEMSPYLLLGFLIAGVLHVFVPRRFYTRYLSKDNKWAVVWATPGLFRALCAIVLTLLIIFALIMKLFERFSHKEAAPDTAVYVVEGMKCSHCEAAVEGTGYTFKGRK